MTANDMSEQAVVKTHKRGRWVVLAALLVGLPVGGWAVWSYLFYGQQDDNLVVLRADPTPFRVKPAEGTQASVPNQDSTFMNLIDGTAEDNSQSEVISLSDPTPEPPPVPLPQAEPAETGAASAEQENRQQTAQSGQQQTGAPDTDEPDEAVTANQTDQTDQTDQPDQIVTAKPATAPQADDARKDNQSAAENTKVSPEDAPTDLTASLVPPTAPKPRPAGAKDRRDWMMVQLAAFREEDKARTAAALLNEKHKARLGGYSLGVSSVTSTDGQLFWRVITDALPKQDALSVCEELKRSGQDCILRQQKEQSP